MSIKRVEHVALPYAGRRHTSDTSRLSLLYANLGRELADTALRKGAITQQGLQSLAGLFSNFSEGKRADKAAGVAASTRQAERAENMAFEASQAEATRAERAAEREAAAAARSAERDEDRAIRAGEQAAADTARTVDRTRPGVVNPALYDQVKRLAPNLAEQFQVQDGVPVLMRTPEQERQATVDAATAADRTADNTRADEALKLQRQALNQRPTASADNEPLESVVGPDGKPILVRRSDAVGRQRSSGAERPASGVQKRVLNFFNRAEQADKDIEAMESDIQKMGLMDQGRLKLAPNLLQTPMGRQYTQAQRAFTEARLRKDSGAAIPPHEYEADQQTYFAQPGDDKVTLENKRRGRAAILASLASESGQALSEFLGDAEEAAAVVQQYRQRMQRPVTVDQVPSNASDPVDALILKYSKPPGGQ